MYTLSPFVLLLLLSISSYYSTNAQLYDFNLNARVNVGNQPHFKLNYYPGSTNANYHGDFYPDIENCPTIRKYSFTTNKIVETTTDFRYPQTSLSPQWFESFNSYQYDTSIAFIVPVGITVTFRSETPFSTILVKGKLVLDPSYGVNFNIGKLVVFPGGVFESIPNSGFNHTIMLKAMDGLTCDPLKTSNLISLGGTVTIRGFDTTSVWQGTNNSYTGTSYKSTFLKSFPSPQTTSPVFKMSGTRSANNIVYSLHNFYRGLSLAAPSFITDSSFGGAGYIFMRPWTKNVFIKGVNYNSMVFTGPSIVDFQNVAVTDVGHTTSAVLNENVLTPNGANYDIITIGTNPSDRYPITLLHVTQSVNIQNCMFFEVPATTTKYSNSPRSFIGAKRSFGNLIGNAFALKGASGISLLHGTEAFTIGFNGFISLYSDSTSPATRSYPDINHLNGGIVSTSPYSTYNNNAFEGRFKGGALQLIPIQSRSTVIGLSSDLLLGSYSGLTQYNTESWKTNNVWNNLVYSNNFFAGESEFRVTYSSTAQPPIKINMFAGWLINWVASKTLAANQANIEFVFDSPYIANSLSIMDRKYAFTNDALVGQYNSISIKNSYAPCNYKFFADTFFAKFISIRNSIFSHYSNSAGAFLSPYAGQLFFENVNGTKMSIVDLIPFYYPLYKLEMKTSPVNGLLDNQLEFTFIPNFDFAASNGQSLSFLIDQVDHSAVYESNLYNDGLHTPNFITNVTSISKVVSFDSNFANGPHNVMVLSNSFDDWIPAYTKAGPFFAHTHIHDKSCVNFHMGISISSNAFGPTPHALSIFGNQWTTCEWFNSKCTTSGSYSSVSPTPTSISTVSSAGVTTSVTSGDELVMLSSYLSSTVSTSTPTVVNILLGQGVYKFYIYTINPTWTGATVLDSLPLYTVKVSGKYQEPFTRPTPSHQKYQKLGPFFWNNVDTVDQILVIEWASDNIKYSIPICGVEIFSTSTTPYPVFL